MYGIIYSNSICVLKKEEREEKEKRYKDMKWWKKCRKLAESFFATTAGKNKGEQGTSRSSRQFKVWWTLGNLDNGYSFC